MNNNEPKRMFKRVNVLGLDFYVDWMDKDGCCERIICVKDVHGGRIFVYQGLTKDGVPVEDLLLEACGVKKKEPEITSEKLKDAIKAMNSLSPEKIIEQVAPAALETEQPKEELNAEEGKKRTKRSKK